MDEKLSLKTVAGYGSGDFALHMALHSVGFWLLYFYTDVFGITASAAGSVFFIARVWDAVNDPMMGYLADHTRTKWGKFRPYLLFAGIPLAVSFVLCFSTPDLDPRGKFIYAVVTYLMLNTFFTLVNIPFGALSAVMTQDDKERTRLASSRMVFVVLAGGLISIGTPYFVGKFANERTGYSTVTIGYAVMMVVIIWIVYANTFEKDMGRADHKIPIGELKKVVTRNGPLLVLCLAIFTGMCATTIRNATVMYYFEYYIGRAELVPAFFAVVGPALLAGILLTTSVSKRIGKRNTFIVSTTIANIANIILYFTPGSRLAAIFGLCGVAAFGGGFVLALMWSMVPDTVEYAEWKTGHRGEGIIYGVYGFVQKFAMAIGGMLGGKYLSYVGYAPKAVQSHESLRGILNSFVLFPLISSLLATLIIVFYRLDSETFERIKIEISEKKN